MREDLIERLRSVKWEVTDDGGRMPDDPTHKCVFVDMRPNDFRALLREAASALEAAQENARRWQHARKFMTVETIVNMQRRAPIRESDGMNDLADAAIDAAIAEGDQA